MPHAKIYVRNIRGNSNNVHTVRLEENQIILSPRNQEIKNLMRQRYLEGINISEIQKLQKGDYVESPKLA